MLLFLAATMHELKVDDHTFFRIAYVWSFGCDANITSDVLIYKEKGFLPPYLVNYLNHLKETK